MATSGQTLNDRINAARYALAGQGLARCVCKATTEEIIGPKKKHLDYLLACTHEPNVSIPQLANLLIERTNHIYWVVVYKALVTVHHLMSYGNERFIQYLASSNYSLELSTFIDKTAARDFSMSTYIRRYSAYINEKALSYRLLAFDFCKVKRGNEGVLRLMPIDRLLKTLPILHKQLNALLEFNCSANDLNNGVINACFMLLFRDLIGLFACYNDGIINLLNKYFTLNRKMCREALDLYKNFLKCMDRVSEFLRVAEVVGIDKDEIPDLRRAPSSLVDALEEHLQNIESNKKILKQSGTSGKSGAPTGEFSVLGNLTPPSSRRPNSPGGTANATASQNDDIAISNFKDDEVRKALEEEARVLSQYGGGAEGSKNSKILSSKGDSDTSPKFAVTTIPKSIDDIFGDADSFNANGNGVARAATENNGTSLAFDNLSSTSSAAKSRTAEVESIKSSIKSATTTLEKSGSAKPVAPKKASDDLFALLDSATETVGQQAQNPMSGVPVNPVMGAVTGMSSMPQFQIGGANPMSPFAAPLPANNNQIPSLKSGNPFPDAASNAFAFNPPQASTVQTDVGSAFNPGASTANYTNLGGFDNFGDLLQPMSASGKGPVSSSSAISSGKPLASTGLFKGDLDATLANLAQNLTFDGISKTKK